MTRRLPVFESPDVVQTLRRLADLIESTVYSQRFSTIRRMEVPQIGRRGTDTHHSDPAHAYTMPCERLDHALSVCALRVASNMDVEKRTASLRCSRWTAVSCV
jgi:hypothetical protein